MYVRARFSIAFSRRVVCFVCRIAPISDTIQGHKKGVSTNDVSEGKTFSPSVNISKLTRQKVIFLTTYRHSVGLVLVF